MQTIQKTFYVCDGCKTEYGDKAECLRCESKAVERANVMIGDKVKVLSGDGSGEIAIVKKIKTINKDWGHYMAKHYHHTQGIEVDFSNGSMRFLTFDAYKKI